MGCFSELISYFLGYIIALILVYIIGGIIFNVLNKQNKSNNFTNFSISAIIGFLFISSLTACLKTKFHSVFNYQFLFFVGLIIYAVKQKKIEVNFKINLQLIYLLTTNYILYILLFNLHSKNFHFDFIFFGQLSKSIYNTGVESINSLYLNYFDNEKMMLYHYSDYWLTGLISSLTKLPETYVLLYIIYPIIINIIIINIYSLINNYIENKISCYIYSIGLIFGTKIFFEYTNNELGQLIPMFRNLYEASLVKTSVVYLPILLAFYYDKQKRYLISVCFLTLTPFIYPTTTISITIVIFLYLFFLYFKNSHVNKRYILVTGLVYLSYLIYIKIITNNPLLKLEFQLKSLKYYIIQILELNIKLFFESILLIALSFFYITYFYVIKKASINWSNFKFSIFFYLGIICSLFFVTLHKPFTDNNQIINNISPVFSTILFIEILVLFNKKSFIMLNCIIFLFSIFYNFNFENISKNTKYKNNLTTNFSSKFISESIKMINKPHKINSIYFSNKIHEDYLYTPFNKFDYLSKEYNFNMPFIITNAKCFVRKQTFLVNGIEYDLNKRKEFTSFIKKHKINIIITESKWLRFFLEKFNKEKKDVTVLTDPNTKSSIFKINNRY